jgi:hypothetical protein
MVNLTRSESFGLDKMFCCVEARGKNAEGKEICIYFGIHLHNLQRLLADVKEKKQFNPKNYNAGVLAWAVGGEPTKEMKKFMRTKFSYNEDVVILEIA